MPPVRTSGPDVLQFLVRSTAALACVVMLASCTSGGSEADTANPCGISPPSEEGKLVGELLGTKGFDTKAVKTTSGLVEETERALRLIRPEKHRFSTDVCRYTGEGEQGQAKAVFASGWFLKDARPPAFASDSTYDLNGARGFANGGRSTLFVQCDLPGDLREQSQKVWLRADTSYTFSPSTPTADQTAKDRGMTLTYLMARRVTDALGCENEPLAQAPVVKPLPTP